MSAERTEKAWKELKVGGMASGAISQVKEYGLVCDLDAHEDLLGLVTLVQVPSRYPALG